MDFHEDNWLRIVLIGTSAIVDSWKVYLTLRNILSVEKMSIPPPGLRISAEGFDRMKNSVRLESSQILLAAVLNSSIRAIKISTNYYPFIWELSLKNGTSSTARAMFFAALDEVITHGFYTPTHVLLAIFRRIDPFLPVIGMTIRATLAASIAALYSYVRIKIHEQLGTTGMLKIFVILNGVGLLVWAIFIRFKPLLRPSTYHRLPHDEMGRAVRTLTTSVGYPPEMIFIDEKSPSPNAYYCNAIITESIIINRFLTLFVDVPQLLAIVAHELGHWKHCHAYYEYCGQVVEKTAACCLWTFAYGNEQLPLIFRMDPGVHPIAAELLAYRFIWVTSSEVFYGVCRLINTQMELAADEYSCQVWNPKSLREALLQVSFLVMKPSTLNDNLYSAWFLGYPSFERRIRRIDALLNFKEHSV